MQGNAAKPYIYEIVTKVQKFHGPYESPLRGLSKRISGRAAAVVTLDPEETKQAIERLSEVYPSLKISASEGAQLTVSQTSSSNLPICLRLNLAGHCGSRRQAKKTVLQRIGDILILKVSHSRKWFVGVVSNPAQYDPFTPLRPEFHKVKGNYKGELYI